MKQIHAKILAGLALVLAVTSCQDYEDPPHLHNEQHLGENPNVISGEEFSQKTQITKPIEFFNSSFARAKSLNDSLTLSFNDFNLTDETIYYYSNNFGIETYTFYLEPLFQPQPNVIYNLVLKKDLNNQWNSKIFELTKSTDSEAQKSYSDINQVLSSDGLAYGIAKGWQGEWQEQTEEHCTNTGKCASGKCDRCSLCITTRFTYVMVYVEDENIDAGDSSSGGGGRNGGGNSSGNSDDSFAANPGTINADGDNDDVIIQEPNTECNKIKGFAEAALNQDYMTQLRTLSNEDTLNLDKEKAISMFEGSNDILEQEGTEGNPYVPIFDNPPNNYVVLSHTHPNIGDGTLSVFSPDDLLAIATIAYNNKLSDNFVAFLPTQKGTFYALTVNNPQKLIDFFFSTIVGDYTNLSDPIGQKEQYFASKDNFKKIYSKYFKPENPNRRISETDGDNETVLKEFLKFMDEADLGVTLFDAEPTDGHPNPFETFKKLSLKNGSPLRQDCN